MTVFGGDIIFAADINAVAAASSEKPMVRLVASGTQSIPDATQTAVLFSAEEWDTHGFHSTSVNTSRITPTVAGKYTFNATYYTSGNTDYVTTDVAVGKNGTAGLATAPAERRAYSTPATQVTNAHSLQVVVTLEANGTTDYFEMIVFQDSAGAKNTNQSARFTGVFECVYERPL